jgi:hypothetical protein
MNIKKLRQIIREEILAFQPYGETKQTIDTNNIKSIDAVYDELNGRLYKVKLNLKSGKYFTLLPAGAVTLMANMGVQDFPEKFDVLKLKKIAQQLQPVNFKFSEIDLS